MSDIGLMLARCHRLERRWSPVAGASAVIYYCLTSGAVPSLCNLAKQQIGDASKDGNKQEAKFQSALSSLT